MNTIVEGALTFRFPKGCQASKYDDWAFYRNQFQSVAKGCKAVDIVCITADACWLLEIKDYRQDNRTKAIDIAQQLATKVRDTLAGLASAAKNANSTEERQFAHQAVASSRRWRVALHLEQPATPRRLWPTPIDQSNMLKKLRTKSLKAVDAHPVIYDRNTLPSKVPWTVS
ncbi:MAG: hypothetical protein F4149_08925 [Gammaproteobacteria bacterium]|nr:hypothetical protein [Gammaproteobacteria bacterium]MYK82494.1 hypothetical protein [Gammaproteobacteria bacterium]